MVMAPRVGSNTAWRPLGGSNHVFRLKTNSGRSLMFASVADSLAFQSIAFAIVCPSLPLCIGQNWTGRLLLPISEAKFVQSRGFEMARRVRAADLETRAARLDRKSTRLNSSHLG